MYETGFGEMSPAMGVSSEYGERGGRGGVAATRENDVGGAGGGEEDLAHEFETDPAVRAMEEAGRWVRERS